jgi:hypothetical protein
MTNPHLFLSLSTALVGGLGLSFSAHAVDSQLPTWLSTWIPGLPVRPDLDLLVRATADGAVLQLAQTRESPNTLRPVVIRYAADGTRSWVVSDTTSSIRSNSGADLVLGDDDTAVLAFVDVADLVVRKFNSRTGAPIWERRRALSIADQSQLAPKLARTSGNGRISVAIQDQGDFLVASFAEDGTAAADWRWGSPDRVDYPTAIAPTPDGGYVVTGLEANPGFPDTACNTVGVGADNVVRFHDHDTGINGNQFTPSWLAVDATGNSYVLTGPETTAGLFGMRLYKLATNGQRLWTMTGPVDPGASAEPLGFTLLADGSTTVVYASRVGESSDFAVSRFDPDGGIQWNRTFAGTNGAHLAFPRAFAVNLQGRTRVTGFAYHPGQPASFGQMTEWTNTGALCVALTISVDALQPTVSQVEPLQGDWLLSGDARGGISVWRYPAVSECDDAELFGNGFEQP